MWIGMCIGPFIVGGNLKARPLSSDEAILMPVALVYLWVGKQLQNLGGAYLLWIWAALCIIVGLRVRALPAQLRNARLSPAALIRLAAPLLYRRGFVSEPLLRSRLELNRATAQRTLQALHRQRLVGDPDDRGRHYAISRG